MSRVDRFRHMWSRRPESGRDDLGVGCVRVRVRQSNRVGTELGLGHCGGRVIARVFGMVGIGRDCALKREVERERSGFRAQLGTGSGMAERGPIVASHEFAPGQDAPSHGLVLDWVGLSREMVGLAGGRDGLVPPTDRHVQHRRQEEPTGDP